MPMPIPSPVPIVRRRVNIPFDSATTCGWLASEKDIEDVLNAVSFVFPPGERFFIRSVQNYQDRIADPQLKEQVKAFVFQEAMHSKEHARANARLAETFTRGPEIEEAVARSLARVSKYAPRASQLAFTCALEHFTAILSHNLLRWQGPFIEKADPALAAMWLWHAVEEAEHKAVCFDVYREVCGSGVLSYLHRIAAMMAATVLFSYSIFLSVRSLKQSRKERGEAAPGSDHSEAKDARPSQGLTQILREIVPLQLYFDYYRPSFHPWNTDDSALIDEWKRRYRDYAPIRDATPAEA
ncbi:metal-dependent hydrolase [Pseudorhodoplanes sp.]|uniref:metal-dependent hydrolase n=1 Tax=Pseudorhodoplanes sp. TaxID=1934341 RepID=UPI003918A9BC